MSEMVQNATYCAGGMFPKDEEIQQKTCTKHDWRIQHRCLQYHIANHTFRKQ